MEGSRLVQSGGKQQSVRLGISVGLALLSMVILLWASTGGAPAMASPPAVAEATVLSNSNVITIGVAADMSGPVDSIGWRQANAVQLAVSQINAAGGVDIGGAPYSLALVTADSACNAAQAVTAAETLLTADAVAVVGHTCSGASFAAQPIYNGAGVPMISPSSGSIGLTQEGYTTTFRVFPRDDAQAILMATHFRQSLGMGRVALVDWSGFEWSTEAFSSTFVSLGGSITGQQTVGSTDDYTATLTAIQAEDPDAVFYADWDANRAGFLSSIAHNLGLSVIGWDADNNEAALGDYAIVAGGAAEGDYAGLNPRRTQDMPGYDTLNADYQAAAFPNYGDEAEIWGALAYDALRIIVDAMDRADSADPTAIRDAIAATADYHGVVGIYVGFDSLGDVIPQWSWLELYQNGEWEMVYPYNKVFLPLVLKNLQ
jgi:branched-chain amino acid transport system substrate-binding protein